ncbi:MAG: ribosomal RNA small subunit methyltransferase A, partial [Sphingomonadales bacterium]
LVAPVGSKAYGRLSVLTQWRAEASLLFDIGPKAFTPPPKVTSALVYITPTEAPQSVSVDALSRITAAAFGQRRKMLRQSLKSLGIDPIALCEAAELDPTTRADAVPVADYVSLARALPLLP